MLNDEEILLKTAKLLENFDISDKKPEKLLREVTEDELETFQRIAGEMELDEIAFDKLFDGKRRLVIDFPVKDTDTELGKFVDLLEQELDLDVDWEKGIVSAEREWYEHSLDKDADLINLVMGGEGPHKLQKRKFSMKIGKYFAKLDKLISQYKAMRMDILHYGVEGDRVLAWYGRITGAHMQTALDEKELKRFNQILNQLELYAGNATVHNLKQYVLGIDDKKRWIEAEQARRDAQDKTDVAHGKEPRKRKPIGEAPETKFVDLGKYWLNNAAYIKKEVKNLANDKYSIILTRDPIDVYRMSDFDNITSCHSPPSRDGGGSYFKCAVAEAHGLGAVAYVVETEDLLHDTNTSNIDSAEQEIQEGEIFFDDQRYGTELDLKPVSRVRLRNIKYYPEDEELNAPRGQGIQLAVPEKATYGKRIPGFVKRVRKWALDHQKEAMEAISADGATDDRYLYGKRFVLSGGHHQDTQFEDLLGVLFDKEPVGVGIKDTEVERSIPDHELLAGTAAAYETECMEIRQRYNNRYSNCAVDFDVQDDGAGGVYIECSAGMHIEWDADEWAKLPEWKDNVGAVLSDFQDVGMNFIDNDGEHINTFDSSSGPIVRLTLGISAEGVSHVWLHGQNMEIEFVGDFLNGSLANSPDGFDEFCSIVDKIDDLNEGIKAHATELFKREGWIKTSKLYTLGMEAYNGEIGGNFSEWDIELDEDFMYEDRDPDWITATQVTRIDPSSYGFGADKVSPAILQDILGSRDFHIEMRRQIHKMGTLESQYVNSSVEATPTNVDDPDYTIKFKLHLTDSSSERQVQAFRDIVEDVQDEEEIEAMIVKVIKHFINARQSSHMQKNLDENKKYDANWAVNRWRLNL